MTDSFTSADGLRLAYERRGSGALLVCHPGGPGLSSREFVELAGLEQSFELVLLDPRGTGGSERPRDSRAYKLSDYVADLDALRAHLDVERFTLLGMSHGGIVAMAYAAEHGDHLDRLLLVATLAHFGEANEAAMRRGMEERAGEPWFADAQAALEEEQAAEFADDEQLKDNLWRQWPLYFGRFGERERAYLDASEETPNGDALRYFNEAEWATFDLRDRLKRIDVPTLIVAGDRDFIAGPVAANVIHDGIASSELVVIPGAGHFPYVEAPEAFRGAVTRFAAVPA